MSDSLEIRLHGRGGQGGVTCAKILAACYAQMGKYVQTFGDYAGERSGAPVAAFTRVDDKPITNRNKVYNPDHLLVLDPSLLGATVLQGLAPGAPLLLNTTEELEAFDATLGAFQLATIDATSIARKHGIGTRSVVIVNTTIAGAFARTHDIPLEVLEKTYEGLGFQSNFPAAREAYEVVRERPPIVVAGDADQDGREQEAVRVGGRVPVDPLAEHLESPPTGLETGSWSSQRPAYVEQLAPCNAWGPAGNDVVRFVQAVHTSGEAAAAEILGYSTPLAAVCGRVCPAPCMEGCNRREYDGSVHIRGLERKIAEHTPVAVRQAGSSANPHRIAVVGGGPAGIAAAYALAMEGHRATIYDGEESLGGVLRTGIPVYRLPREVLDREISDVLALGVEARLGEFLDGDRVAALAEEYDGVVLATGLQWLRGLKVPGADLEGLEQGIQFLHRFNSEGCEGTPLSGHVVVLGGGNTAMDCARSALRAGASRVTVAYRRRREEMPAIREEIDEAVEEGVVLLLQRQPVAFHGEGKVAGIELAEVVMGEPDDTGRRSPVVTDVTSRLDCDAVLLALGQGADLDFLPEGWKLEGSTVTANGKPLPVVAAGDLATGDGTVTHAIGSGRRAAGLVLQALGEEVEVFERPDRTRAVPATAIRLDHWPRVPVTREGHAPAETRVGNLDEVNHGLVNGAEAARCFSCGHCTKCDTCLVYCPEGIITRATSGFYRVDSAYCKGCGVCVEECPRRAMEMHSL